MQRVSSASVSAGGQTVARIDTGLLVLLGVALGDAEEDARYLAGKVARLRIFEDGQGRMNLSLLDKGYSALVVSQFTLLADTAAGNRPGFSRAAPPEVAQRLYRYFIDALKDHGVQVGEGVFRAQMAVSLVNEGPVTLLMESKQDKTRQK